MADKCYEPGEFDRLLGLEPGHADLQHLDTCPDCRTQLDMYSGFLERDNVPDGADPADANARLGAFLEQEIGPAKPSAPPRPAFNLRRWSPVLVAACLVCVALFIQYGDQGDMTYPTGVVRDMSEGQSDLTVALAAVEDGFNLSWTGPVDATAYHVVIQDANLTEIARLDAGSGTGLKLARGDFPWLQGPAPLFWFVTALRDGDEIARSSLRALEAGS